MNISELEALGSSQLGPKLLQTLSQVQFKGLAGDFRFINGQLQPSVFEIVNVLGTRERSIGFWTEENGLVKKIDQQPRSSESALSTWKDHLKPIIWPGDADSVPKGWEIPTNGKKLRIGVPKRTGYTDLVKVTRDPITNSTVITGFCIDFFEAVIRELPYDVSYEFIPFEKRNGKAAGNYNDLVHQVFLGVSNIRSLTNLPFKREQLQKNYLSETISFILSINCRGMMRLWEIQPYWRTDPLTSISHSLSLNQELD